MPQGWGQRYYEEQPPEDHLPHNSGAKFHEVFGNNKVRKFQRGRSNSDSNPNRGRRNFRGLGRDQRGNPSTRRRTPDAPDARTTGQDYDTSARTPDIFGAAGNRPSFQQRNSGGKRRKRYVPGGRIPKFKRIKEYNCDDTYCEVCDEAFRDDNAKALHDRSKKHRLNYGYLRAENSNKDDEDHMTDVAQPSHQSEEDHRKQFEEGTNAFLSIDFTKLPKPFQEWVNRSLAEGKKAAVEASDPSILQAIQREVVDVYRVNDANCTLRRVCWDRRELASGTDYRLMQTTAQGLPVIQDSKIHIKPTHLPKKEDEKPKPEKQRPKPTNRSPPREVSKEEEEERVDDIPRNAAHPQSKPTPSVPVHRELLPYREMQLTWRLSRDAEDLLYSCQTRHKEAVLENYYKVFGSGNTEDVDHEQEELETNESLTRTYRELRCQYDSEEYEYENLMSSLSSLAKQFEKTGKRVEHLRPIYQMQILAALQGGEFCDCVEPCSKYVGTFSQQSYVRGRSFGLVSHWLISLLFKNNTGAGRKNFPATLQVAEEMRKLPIGAVEDIGVYEAIQAVKGVLGNNWCQFFGRSLPSIVHCHGPTFKQILEGLFPFMRERALVIMTCANIKGMRESNGRRDIKAEVARKLLGWDTNEDVEESIAEMKEFVTSLQQNFVFSGEGDGVGDDSCRIRLKEEVADVEDLTLSRDSDVRVEMLAKWSKPVVLDED